MALFIGKKKTRIYHATHSIVILASSLDYQVAVLALDNYEVSAKKWNNCIRVIGSFPGSRNMNVEFTWGHTTQTMAVGYMSTDDRKPKVNL